MLYDVLTHGTGAAVRRLIYSCFSLLYSHGDSVSIYMRVSGLQAYLSSKEGMSRSTPESIRVGLLDLLAHLYARHGRMLAGSALESAGIASRTVSKSGNQAAVRCAALRLCAAVVRALGSTDRSASAAQAEAWAAVQRNAKDKTCEEVRSGCMALLAAICAAGGRALWREGAYGAEEALRLGLALAEDGAQAVCDAACRALGELAACARSPAASEALAGEQRPAKKASVERVVGSMVRGALVTPLVESAVHGKRQLVLALSGAWVSYLAALPCHRAGHDHTADLTEAAILLLTAVGEAGRMAAEARSGAAVEGAGELGAGLAGGELPPLQACALRVLRGGVLGALGEVGQRKLMERLALALDKRLPTPAAVVALEALSALLEAAGEVQDEAAATLERLLRPYLAAPAAATRQQAAAALAALAAAHPAAAAHMLDGCLDTVASCAVQMAAPLSPVASFASASASISLSYANGSTGTPKAAAGGAENGNEDAPAGEAAASATSPPSPAHSVAGSVSGATGVRPSMSHRSLMDTCHGAALGAARLLVAAARAPLGCPGRLQRRALALAEDLVTGPGPEIPANRSICREVGYLLLGSLCALGVAQAGRSHQDMAALWQGALGESAAKALDERSYLRPSGEVDLAVQLWWRAAALQALTAYVAACVAADPSLSGPGTGAGVRHGSWPRGAGSGLLSHGSSFASAPSFSSRSESGLMGSGASFSRSGSAGGLALASGGEGEGEASDLASALGPLLTPLWDAMEQQPYLQDPVRARGGPGGVLAGAAATLTLSLLELHMRLPAGRLGTTQAVVAALAKACLRPFRTGISAGAADSLTACCLRWQLHHDDAPLGPWPAGADPSEEALRAYTGDRGAPHAPPWLSSEEHAALLAGAATGAAPVQPAPAAALLDDPWAGSGAEGAPLWPSSPGVSYPQPVGLGPALLCAQTVLLGRIMGGCPAAQQLQLLDVILAAVQSARTAARTARDAASCRRLPLGVAAAVAALAAYGPAAMAARRVRGPIDPGDKVAEKLLSLARSLLPDPGEPATASESAPLCRAAAELLAASAAAGSEGWAARLVRALAAEAAGAAPGNGDSERRAVLALALGAAHRARGGLAMQGAVPGSADALVSAASRPGGRGGAAWCCHALWLLAAGSGGAFVPRVRTALRLGQELLVSSFESAPLRGACARLANAAVAALGPEFSLGSAAYDAARSLVLASGDGGGAGAGGEAGEAGFEAGGDGGLGMVLFAQQIILFAPQAVPPAKHVPLLLAHLLSRRPALRAASALTLRHLAERSPAALRPAAAAPRLFAALDGEADPRVAGQLRATISTVLAASAPSQPSFWLGLLSDVVFAAGPAPSAAAAASAAGAVAASAAANGPGHANGGGRGAEDEEDEEEHYGGMAAAAPQPAAAQGAVGVADDALGGAVSVREVLSAPHLRTRHVAACCLLALPVLAVAADERHRDPAALEGGGGGTGGAGEQSDLLIRRLQSLVDTGFKLATCPLESLRPAGVRLLAALVATFGGVPDPLMPGARLMEQYQAQVVSALRSSLGARQATHGALPGFGLGVGAEAGSGAGPGAEVGVQHPLLQIAGGMLATTFLESGLAAGDAGVLRRLMELLTAPLAAPGGALASPALRYPAYADWVGARARVELLRAHAQCAAIAAAAAARGDGLSAGTVATAQAPHAAMLRVLWAQLLQDHAVLCSQPPGVLAGYRSPLLEGGEGMDGDRAGAEGADGSPFAEAGAQSGPGGGVTPALAAALRPVYAAACPAALAALAGSMPPAAEVVADASATCRFRRLLEVGLLLLTDAAARLAHAVRAAAAEGAASGGGAVATHGSADAAARVREPAARLAAVLGALQRLLAAEYIQIAVPAAAAPAGSPPPAASAPNHGQDSAVPSSPPAAVACPAGSGHPLVPAAALRDLLSCLCAAAAHALVPLAGGCAGGRLPAALGVVAPGLVLPAAGLVRQVAGAVGEAELGAGAGRRRSSGEGRGSRDGNESDGEGALPSSPSPDSPGRRRGSRPGPSLLAGAVEAVVLLASAAVPYACPPAADGATAAPGAIARPPFMCPQPHTAGVAAEAAQGVVQLLAAAQLLMRRAPWEALEPHAGPLLELPLRLLASHTHPQASGVSAPSPIATAAQRYADGCVALLATRESAAGPAAARGSPPSAGAVQPPSPLSYAAATVAALADALVQQLEAVRQAGAAAAANVSRVAATAGALLSSTAHMPCEAAAGRLSSSGVGAGAGAVAARGRTFSGSGGGSGAAPGLRSPRAGTTVAFAGTAGAPTVLGRGPAGGGPAAPADPVPGQAVAAAAAPAGAQRCALTALAAALRPDVPAAAALAVLEAALGTVQEAAAEEAGSGRGRWARLLAAALVPAAVERARGLMAGARAPLAGEECGLVSGAVKLLLLATTLAAAGPGGAAPTPTPGAAPGAEGCMRLLAPLLVEAAAPAPPACATPALRDLALRLLQQLPAAAPPTGPAFRQQLAAQPGPARLRLQAALREAAAGAGPGSGAAAGGVGTAAAGVGTAAGAGAARKPAIQLKTTFAVPLQR